jgi:hypothetical protein
MLAAMWHAWQCRRRADEAEAGYQSAAKRAALAERKADGYKEALEQSYVGLQALAEKAAEAEWIRETGHVVQPGVWVGDTFIEVEASEPDDVEVGQPVGDSDNLAPELYFPRVGRTYDWKPEMP